MNRFIKGLTLGLLIGLIGIGIISIKQNKQTEEVKIIKTLTESTDNVYLEKGDIYQELNNGSWLIYNEINNTYIFQPSELGDWDYSCNSKEELDKVVNNYMDLKNNK